MLKEIEKTLKLEGLFVNDKADSGGATMAGLSLKYLVTVGDRDNNGSKDFDLDHDGDVDADDVKLLTPEKVYAEFESEWYYKLNIIPIHSVRLRWKIFDAAIHCGRKTGIILFQRALAVPADGIIGSKTIEVANRTILNAVGEHKLLFNFAMHQALYYVDCVIAKPENIKFLRGWLKNRAFDLGEGL